MMRSFVLGILGLLVLGFTVSSTLEVFSGAISPKIVNVIQRSKSSVPPTLATSVSEQVANTISIKELSTKDSSIIQLNSEVTGETIDDVINKIKLVNRSKKKVIYLILNSPGGSVFAGIRLITAMDNSKLPIYTVGVDFCASMCAEILEHGKERYMTDRSVLMFHPASTSIMQDGEVDKIYSRLGSAKRMIDKLDMYVAKRSGQTYADFKAKSMREYWTDAEDALEDHLIDGIVSLDYQKEVPPLSIFSNQLQLDLRN